jgi:hypothetical protein
MNFFFFLEHLRQNKQWFIIIKFDYYEPFFVSRKIDNKKKKNIYSVNTK